MHNLAEGIPHRPPMHWLDTAWRNADGTISARRLIQPDDAFVADGRLVRSALLEMAAQAAACRPVTPTGPPRRGVLAGARDVVFHGDVRAGQTLDIHVQPTKSMGSLMLCGITINADDRPIMSGNLTFAIID